MFRGHFATQHLVVDELLIMFICWYQHGKGYILYRKGFRHFYNIWDRGSDEFVGWEGACIKFSLFKVYHDFLVKLLDFLGPFVRGCSINLVLNLRHMNGLLHREILMVSYMSGR